MGSYSAPAPKLGFETVKFSRTQDALVTAANNFNNPVWLAQWHLKRDPSISPEQRLIVTEGFAACSIVRDSGAGSISMVLAASDDGVQETQGMGTDFMQNNTNVFTQELGFLTQPESPQDLGLPLDFIGVTLRNSDLASTGRVKNIKVQFEVFLPEGATLERLI